MDLPVYFIRHKWDNYEDGIKIVNILEDEKRIAIHFNEEEKESFEEYSEENQNNKTFKSAWDILKDLRKSGAIVVANYHKGRCLIGEVEPNSKIEFLPHSYGVRRGYKTLRLRNTQTKKYSDFPLLPILFPPMRTISKLSNNKDKFVKCVYEGKELPFELDSLFPKIQEQMCVEWLRSKHCNPEFRLEYLLLGIGGTMEAIDIYGITNKEKELVAQVTFTKANKEIDIKKESLKTFSKEDSIKLFFLRGDTRKEEGINFISLQDIWNDFAKDDDGNKMLKNMLGQK